MKAQPVVHIEKFAFIKESLKGSYDVWQWNVWKRKWVRMANTNCGWSSKEDAIPSCREVSKEIENMFAWHTANVPPMP